MARLPVGGSYVYCNDDAISLRFDIKQLSVMTYTFRRLGEFVALRYTELKVQVYTSWSELLVRSQNVVLLPTAASMKRSSWY